MSAPKRGKAFWSMLKFLQISLGYLFQVLRRFGTLESCDEAENGCRMEGPSDSRVLEMDIQR